MREEEILERWGSASEWERRGMLLELGTTGGESGARFLKRIVGDPDPAEKPLRLLGLLASSWRGMDVTDDVAAYLSAPNMGPQLAAASMLAHHGDSRACEPMLEWLRRKLRKKGRVWGDRYPMEIERAVTCIARYDDSGTWLAAAGTMLRKHSESLDGEEKAWLRLHWSGLFTESEPVPLPSAAEVNMMTSWLQEHDPEE